MITKEDIQKAAEEGRKAYEERLRRLGQEEIEKEKRRLKVEQEKKERYKREEKERIEKEKKEAEEIISALPQNIKYAAERAGDTAHVMFLRGNSCFAGKNFGKLTNDLYNRNLCWEEMVAYVNRTLSKIKPEHLAGVAKLVFEECEKLGKPYIISSASKSLHGNPLVHVGEVLREGFEMRFYF